MTKKLPQKIFVKWESPGNDEPYLVAGTWMEGMVDTGGKTKLGTYQLVETVDAKMVLSTSKPIKAR